MTSSSQVILGKTSLRFYAQPLQIPWVETTFCEPNGRVFISRQILQKIACISKVSEIGAGESAPGNPRKRPFLLSRLLSVRPSSGPYPPQKTCVRTKEMRSVMLPLIIVVAYTHYSCRFKGSTYPTGPIVLRTTLGSKSWSASHATSMVWLS